MGYKKLYSIGQNVRPAWRNSSSISLPMNRGIFCGPWRRLRKRDRVALFFWVAVRAGTISDNQRDGEKNSGKKSKSIPYNEKMVGHGFKVRIRSRYERVV